MTERKLVRSHRNLAVYRVAYEAAMEVFEVSKDFPVEERYSLTVQIRRSSRSVNTNLAAGWRKRRHESAFVAKLSDAEAGAAETLTWLEFAIHCGYLETGKGQVLFWKYDDILGKLATMIANPGPWLLDRRKSQSQGTRRYDK